MLERTGFQIFRDLGTFIELFIFSSLGGDIQLSTKPFRKYS